jgi:hypothetical protein
MASGWVLSFAFDSFARAGPIYERARDLVFANDVDASVYRIVLNGLTYVVALGFVELPPAVGHEIERILSQGEDAVLPEEVLLALALRHAEMRAPGMKYERRGLQQPTIEFG